MINLSTIIGAITALIFGAVALWFGGKSRGKTEQKAKSDIQQAQQSVAQEKIRTESVKVANDAQQKSINSSDSKLDEELSKWTRD